MRVKLRGHKRIWQETGRLECTAAGGSQKLSPSSWSVYSTLHTNAETSSEMLIIHIFTTLHGVTTQGHRNLSMSLYSFVKPLRLTLYSPPFKITFPFITRQPIHGTNDQPTEGRMKKNWLLEKFSKSRNSIFRRVRKIAKSDNWVRHVLSVSPSVRMKQLGSHWTNVDKTWHLSFFFRESVDRIHVPLKSNKNNGYFTRTRFDIYDNISLNSS